MEEEALAKLQKEKRTTVSPSSSSAATLSKSKPRKSSPVPPQRPSSQKPEKDLIMFPETSKPTEQDQFKDIDVDKLTNEELEKLLLDENFGTNSSVSRPSSLLGFNLSASYPGGHVSPFQSSQWASVLSTPSSSNLSTPTHQPAPLFPSAPFSKPVSFQNGFTPTIPPYMALSGQQSPFMPFTPIQTAPPTMVFPQQTVDPQMAKLLDKIASTSEYLKNGKSSGTDQDSSQAGPASLAPKPLAQQLAGTESAGISRFDWLDLDPLTKQKTENEEGSQVAGGGSQAEPAGDDPWDAILETKGSSSSPPLDTKVHSQHRRASIGGTVSRNHSLHIPASSSPQLEAQVGGVCSSCSSTTVTRVMAVILRFCLSPPATGGVSTHLMFRHIPIPIPIPFFAT